MPRDNDDDGGDGKARWLTTYGDAMTLLLVFFVLLLSMSTINPETFQIVISSFQGAVGVLEGGKTMTPAKMMDMGINVHELSEAETTVNQNIPKEVEEMLQVEQDNATVRRDERGIVIQITNKLLFDRGQIELTQGGQEFLGSVSNLLKAPGLNQRQVRIEGHTDNIPTENYESNWQISALRATNVVEVLTEAYDVEPSRLSAVGFGQHRPIATNDNEEGRGENRRVEVVILREDIESNEQ